MNTITKYHGAARPLSEKRRLFALHLASGLSQGDAYQKAFEATGSQATIRVAGCRLARDPRIAAEVARLQADLRASHDPATMLDRIEKRQKLAEIARDPKQPAVARLKAIELDNRMTGDDAPQKVEVFGVDNLLAMIRGRATQSPANG